MSFVVACSCGVNQFQVTQFFIFLLLFITFSFFQTVYLFNALVHICVMYFFQVCDASMKALTVTADYSAFV